MRCKILLILTLLLVLSSPFNCIAQEEKGGGGQDRESMALDSTATQWSFQFAYQAMPDYHDDMLDNGQQRPEGNTDYLQLRIVAPIPLETFTSLPRLTLRHYENAQGQSGFGNTELFGLIIPKSWDWGTGRVGIGPLVTLPGDKDVARDEWIRICRGSGQYHRQMVLRTFVHPNLAGRRPDDDTAQFERHECPRHRTVSQLPDRQRLVRRQRRHGCSVGLGQKRILPSHRDSFGKSDRRQEVELEHLWRIPDQPHLQGLAWLRRQELLPLQRDLHDAGRLVSLEYATEREAWSCPWGRTHEGGTR